MERLNLSSCGCDFSAYYREREQIIKAAAGAMGVKPDMVIIDPIEQIPVLKPEAGKPLLVEMDCVEPF